MLEHYLPSHQGMGLHLQPGGPLAPGLRVLAMVCSADSAHAQAEQSVLWPLCAQLQRLGQSVLVLDGSQSESASAPGMAQLLERSAWQAQLGLRPLADNGSIATLPARLGLEQLPATASAAGLSALAVLQRYVRGYDMVLIYAGVPALTALQAGQALQPLLVLPPEAEHLIDSYRQIKHLAVHADAQCTLAAMEDWGEDDGPPLYDWSRKQSSTRTAEQQAVVRRQRLQALLQCSQRHLGQVPALLPLRRRNAGDLQQLTLHALKNAAFLPLHAYCGLEQLGGTPASLAWSH